MKKLQKDSAMGYVFNITPGSGEEGDSNSEVGQE